ncbi:phosphate ABC transporter substrate-binding protein PstS [Mycobacterium paraterrae]|uniref:Phosphate-binding protein n=1 Tax=Mycobacterium paraterrae TaxID=577492 RepID=A0ABY3VP82_9MYCO|nr:phosphate ABC transporter substrate-binding protein PstS [Mycobacterium paraterrae]UMB68464.1 phosphate ABC transporter substrate-binding protein PstS [Mycobacterium paraterrae]
MKLNRFSAALSILVTGVVVLSACGSHNNAAGGSSTTSAPPVKVTCGGKAEVKASGSTAQKNAMAEFGKAFAQACPGQSLDYTADDSSAGINEFLESKNDFAGSDSTLTRVEYDKAQQRCGSPTWNLPMVISPIAIAFNVNGVKTLNLDGLTAAQIFNGQINMWNDGAIQLQNLGVQLPNEPIHVIFRSDESGTTDNFQRYLDTASRGTWGFPAGRKFNGGVGEGVVGNDGAADKVKNTEGSVTYLAWSFAQSEHLNTASIITSAGPDAVAISPESVGKTISTAWFIKKGDDLALDTISFYRPNQPGAYPIVLATYEIVCSKYQDPNVGQAVRAFLQSSIGSGQQGLLSAGYIPIPDEFKPRLLNSINAIS